MLLVIIGLAIAATMLFTGELSKTQKEKEQEIAALKATQEVKSHVVYTTKDIPEGATIAGDSVEEREELQSKIPPDALVSAQMAVGRIAKYGIMAGQLVSSRDLAATGVTVGFESKIKEGARAITFAVDSNSGVAGFVAPGSHVDIIATVGSGDKTKAQAILSDVEVVAVGGTYQKASGATTSVPASSVTVAINPTDANKLIKAIKAGSLYLTLRNEKDHTPVAVVDVTSMFEKPIVKSEMAALPPPAGLPPPPLPGAPSGSASNAPEAPPPPELQEIELWSGSKKEVISVPKS
jgi:pilus assembly protein CpaB